MKLLREIKHLSLARRKSVRVALLSLVGTTLLAGVVLAAVNVYSSQEGESGSRAGNAGLVADATASGGSAIKFGQAAGACAVPSRLTINSGNQSSYPTYSLGTQVYVPGGPDPWQDGTDTLGGCFPGPIMSAYRPVLHSAITCLPYQLVMSTQVISTTISTTQTKARATSKHRILSSKTKLSIVV